MKSEHGGEEIQDLQRLWKEEPESQKLKDFVGSVQMWVGKEQRIQITAPNQIISTNNPNALVSDNTAIFTYDMIEDFLFNRQSVFIITYELN